jgi:ketose-bisphosphate aldolase
MPLVPFNDLMAAAERGGYAVGYFESWNMESLQAVADAAQATRSPVILGFSGLYLPHPGRIVKERLSLYAALGMEACQQLPVPACLLFNESPYLDWVLEAIDLGFGLVMFSDEELHFEDQVARVCQVVDTAHRFSVAVEGELAALPGVGGELSTVPDDLCLTAPGPARAFVERTDVDALAVNIGQAHLHGRREVRLNLSRLAELREAVPAPLVVHGASSVHRADLQEAIRLGVRKINVASVLKRAYFEDLRRACAKVGGEYNPYEVIGSGLENDIFAMGRVALQKTVEDLMYVFGSAGKA